MAPIGVENILSLILVNENIRPAFLFQSNSINELSILVEIKKQFTELTHSNDYTTYQGTIISRKNYNGQQNITTEEMGKILGYPCYKGFDSLDRSKTYYTIDIVATSTTGKKYYILTNVCPNKSNLFKFTKIAEKARWAFAKEKYKPLIGNDEIKTVDVVVTEEIPTQYIINKLIQNKNLTKEEKDKVINILFNFGFSMILEIYFIDKFQYDNPVHRGILLSLLLREINDNLTPFFPLQNYPEQDVKVEEITQKFEEELIKVLKKTANQRLLRRTTVKKHV